MRWLCLVLLSSVIACSEAPPVGSSGAAVEAAEPGPSGADAPSAQAGSPDAAPQGADSAMARLDEAKGLVRSMMDKAEARAAVVGVLGEPALETDDAMIWLGVENSSCKTLKVQLMGDFTGNVAVSSIDCNKATTGDLN